MTVATPVQPNFNTMSAAIYKAALDAQTQVLGNTAAMYAPHEAATPDMTVKVDAGRFMAGAVTLVTNAQQTTATLTAPVTNPRIDRVVIDAVTGVVSVVAGTENASPTPPAIPSGKLPVCQIALATATAAITNSLITDERAFMANVSALLSQDNTWGGTQSMNAKAINEAKGASVAESSGTLNVWAASDGNTVHATASGTPTVSSLGTAPQAGARRNVVVDNAFILAEGANLKCQAGGLNITTAVGDTFQVYADTTSVMYVEKYTRANGAPLTLGTLKISGADNVTPATAGTKLVHANDSEVSSGSTSLIKFKETYVPYGGTFTIEFQMKATDGGTSAGQVHKNGSPLGTYRETTNGAYTLFSENLAVSAGDLVQVYGSHSANATTQIAFFRLKEATPAFSFISIS